MLYEEAFRIGYKAFCDAPDTMTVLELREALGTEIEKVITSKVLHHWDRTDKPGQDYVWRCRKCKAQVIMAEMPMERGCLSS